MFLRLFLCVSRKRSLHRSARLLHVKSPAEGYVTFKIITRFRFFRNKTKSILKVFCPFRSSFSFRFPRKRQVQAPVVMIFWNPQSEHIRSSANIGAGVQLKRIHFDPGDKVNIFIYEFNGFNEIIFRFIRQAGNHK